MIIIEIQIYYFIKQKKKNSLCEVFNNIKCFNLMDKKCVKNACDKLNVDFDGGVNGSNNFEIIKEDDNSSQDYEGIDIHLKEDNLSSESNKYINNISDINNTCYYENNNKFLEKFCELNIKSENNENIKKDKRTIQHL